MKKICALLLSALLLVSMAGCAGPEAPSSAPVASSSPAAEESSQSLPPDEGEEEDEPAPENPELIDFSAKTAAGLMDGSENVCYSPLSLYMALALASTGAEGETLDELMAALGREDTDVDKLATDMADIMKRLPFETGSIPDESDPTPSSPEDYYMAGLDSYRALSIANSIWVDDTFPLAESYQSLAENAFGAEASPVPDFGPETAGKIGGWVNEKTNGLLSPEYQFADDTVMALANTVYLSASWYEFFEEADNTEAPFHLPDGTEADCTYMNKTNPTGTYIKGEGCKGISLGLNGDDTSWGTMTFILPDEGTDPAALLENPETLSTILSNPETDWGDITLRLPKFKFGTTLGSDAFTPLLGEMGVRRAFSSADAQFAPMLADGTEDAPPLCISDIQQDTQIAIDENGVEAAAATMAAMGMGGPSEEPEKVDLIFDRPFLFTISYGGVPLFVGTVANPTAA